MTELPDGTLRALIRLLPVALALAEDLDKSLTLELHGGTGDFAVHSVRGLQARITAIAQDPYIASLDVTPGPEAGDREKVSLARLAAGQLVAFLQGQTGLAGACASHHVYNVKGANGVNLNNVGLPPQVLSRILGLDEPEAAGEETNG